MLIEKLLGGRDKPGRRFHGSVSIGVREHKCKTIVLHFNGSDLCGQLYPSQTLSIGTQQTTAITAASRELRGRDRP